MNDVLLTLCLGVTAFVCAVALYAEIRAKLYSIQIEQRVLLTEQYALSERVHALELTNKRLSEANPKRINYETLRALEDADAALDVMEREIDFDKSLITNTRAHVQRARNPNRK